jgi:hypothetical protein
MPRALAKELGKLGNKTSIEGTHGRQAVCRGSKYGNWELSAESRQRRAAMRENGVNLDQGAQMRSYADQNLSKPA